jgi:hypothetical protein
VTGAEPVSNYARARRLANRYCYGVKIQLERLQQNPVQMMKELREQGFEHAHYTQKNDWETLIVSLTRLRRTLLMLKELEPNLSLDQSHIDRFDNAVPDLKCIRDYEEHFDDYSLGKGRKKAEWGWLESYEYGPGKFANGAGELKAENAHAAMLIAWEAVMSIEENAKKIGYLTWDARYEKSDIEGTAS